MSIVDTLTPVYYELASMRVERDDAGEVIAIGVLRVRNAAGNEVGIDYPHTTLTPAEKTALAAFIDRELGAYETATGLTEWTGTP